VQAVILAGGLGTRLRPLTYVRPKALLPLLNKPMVLHLLEKLPSDIDEVLLAANYKVEQLREFFRTHDLGRKVTIVQEAKALGTGGAIKNLEDRLSGTFLAFNGDIVSSLAVGEFAAAHRRFGGVATIALWEVEDPTAFGVVAMKEDRITRFVEKPAKEAAPSRLANAGAYVLEPEALAVMRPGAEASLERDVFPKLIRKGLYGFRFDGYWSDVGTRGNFLSATAVLLREQGSDVSLRASFGASATVVKPVAVAAGTVVQGKIGPAVVVGRECSIGEARVRHAVLFDRVVVGDGAEITGSLVGDGCRIGSRAKVGDAILEDGAVVRADEVVAGGTVRR
jgi:mannose-1-phosphate guanylyltransferase